MKASEVLSFIGDTSLLTYRQLDFWTSKRWILATDEQGQIHPERSFMGKGTVGSGYRRAYAENEVRKLIMMAHLVRAGVRPNNAAEYARHLLFGLFPAQICADCTFATGECASWHAKRVVLGVHGIEFPEFTEEEK